ncbi:alcohol dehydrogenase catalytic domain-containing protein [Streptomyces sp. NEAU-174]|uniref:alcohol dehydrogenase catalytic domain-containing protein n=1 Tax=Streptomyces sp. NEAU-174 TaxID=3458254 RepID=UPI0040448DA7
MSNRGINVQLRTLIHRDGVIELSFVHSEPPEPDDDEVVIAIEAAPINPTDMAFMFGGVQMPQFSSSGAGFARRSTATLPPARLSGLAGRWNRSLPTGSEGAGLVVRAGSSAAASALLGQRVATFSEGTFSRYCVAKASNCIGLPPDISATEAASAFLNPLTALASIFRDWPSALAGGRFAFGGVFGVWRRPDCRVGWAPGSTAPVGRYSS